MLLQATWFPKFIQKVYLPWLLWLGRGDTTHKMSDLVNKVDKVKRQCFSKPAFPFGGTQLQCSSYFVIISCKDTQERRNSELHQKWHEWWHECFRSKGEHSERVNSNESFTVIKFSIYSHSALFDQPLFTCMGQILSSQAGWQGRSRHWLCCLYCS